MMTSSHDVKCFFGPDSCCSGDEYEGGTKEIKKLCDALRKLKGETHDDSTYVIVALKHELAKEIGVDTL
jgi:hypothetical protein